MLYSRSSVSISLGTKVTHHFQRTDSYCYFSSEYTTRKPNLMLMQQLYVQSMNAVVVVVV